jgi:hypothetical protein
MTIKSTCIFPDNVYLERSKARVGRMIKTVLMSISLIPLMGMSLQKNPMGEVPPVEKTALVQYLKSSWQTPNEYILSKFRDHDLVFLGEGHKFKHDVELVQNLIALLYKNGVANLGIEFGCFEYQDQADRLITAETYDERLARWLMFKWAPYWPYQEYLDIYRKAWELNKSLPSDAPKFRVVHLDYRANWNLVSENMPPSFWKSVFFRGDRDAHMAAVILEEFVKKKKKALIFGGAVHTFKRSHEPDYDFQTKKVRNLAISRMGNIVFKRVRHRAFFILLHFPWPMRQREGSYGYPVEAVIDRIMREFEDERVGFDVNGSPFGRLSDKASLFSAGNDKFTLDTLCDGYIFQKHFREYRGVSVDWSFITPENFQEALEYLPNPKLRTIYKTPYQFLTDMQMKADFKLQFGDLE